MTGTPKRNKFGRQKKPGCTITNERKYRARLRYRYFFLYGVLRHFIRCIVCFSIGAHERCAVFNTLFLRSL